MNKPAVQFWVAGAAVAIFASACIAAESGEIKRLLELSDYGETRSPGAPRLSPDGKQVAFSLDDRIFVVRASGGEPVPITTSSDSAWDPRWSDNGQFLYFLSDRGEASQVWKLPVAGFGEASQLTHLEHGVSSINLSPDASRVLLTFSDDDLQTHEKDGDAPPEPFVITRRQFKRDAGHGYITAGQTSHIYIYDIDSDSLTQITAGPYDESSAAWSPDGRSIVFTSNREKEPDAGYRRDIWVVSAEDSGGDPELLRLTDNTDSKRSPAWSPDGKQIAYIRTDDGPYGMSQIAMVSASGGEPRILTLSLDRSVGSFEFSADGDWIYFNFANAGSRHLSRVRVSDAKFENLIEGDRVVSSFDVGAGNTLAVRMINRNDTSDIYHLNGKRLNRLTDLNHDYFETVRVGNRIKVSFESTDGTSIEAFITTPPGYDSSIRYPTILRLHGGPVAQFSWGYGFTAQYFAARGYVVVEPNPRGSTGHGQDFINAIYRTWGVTDYDDVMASISYAIDHGYADADRLAVTGYSYGGYMTNVVITQTNLFKAAASGAGESLIEANFGHDIYQKWYMWELGVPWENREKYDVVSPFLRAGNIETPTLFLGGRLDWNVPILNSELLYQAMVIREIDTQLVVYPGVHHGGWPEEYDKDYLRRIVAWFDQYLEAD